MLEERPATEKEYKEAAKTNSRDESCYTHNFQPGSLAQTAHHCQVPELKGKKKKEKEIKRETAKA